MPAGNSPGVGPQEVCPLPLAQEDVVVLVLPCFVLPLFAAFFFFKKKNKIVYLNYWTWFFPSFFPGA